MGAAASPAGAGGGRLPRPAAEPVLRIDGVDVPRAEFAAWLVAYHGEVAAGRYAETRAVLDRALEAGFTFTPEELEARVDEDIQRVVEFYYAGDRERWLREVESSRGSLETWRREAIQRAELDLSTEALLKREREITPEMVKTAWEARYGPAASSCACA